MTVPAGLVAVQANVQLQDGCWAAHQRAATGGLHPPGARRGGWDVQQAAGCCSSWAKWGSRPSRIGSRCHAVVMRWHRLLLLSASVQASLASRQGPWQRPPSRPYLQDATERRHPQPVQRTLPQLGLLARQRCLLAAAPGCTLGRLSVQKGTPHSCTRSPSRQHKSQQCSSAATPAPLLPFHCASPGRPLRLVHAAAAAPRQPPAAPVSLAPTRWPRPGLLARCRQRRRQHSGGGLLLPVYCTAAAGDSAARCCGSVLLVRTCSYLLPNLCRQQLWCPKGRLGRRRAF